VAAGDVARQSGAPATQPAPVFTPGNTIALGPPHASSPTRIRPRSGPAASVIEGRLDTLGTSLRAVEGAFDDVPTRGNGLRAATTTRADRVGTPVTFASAVAVLALLDQAVLHGARHRIGRGLRRAQRLVGRARTGPRTPRPSARRGARSRPRPPRRPKAPDPASRDARPDADDGEARAPTTPQAYPPSVPTVELTSHLHPFFPGLGGRPIAVEGTTVGEVVRALEARAPGFAFYVCDETGRLRQHVLVYVGEQRITDRATLTDPVGPDARVLIVQALSGG